MINPIALTGKHILVTGASSGIGAEIAIHITRLGGKVSLFARNEGKLQKVVSTLEDQRGKYYRIDFQNTNEIAPVIKQTYNEQGAFDGVVYCAGIADAIPLKMTKPDKMLQFANVNFLSFVEFVRCTTLKQYRAETMSIVGISSTASYRGDKGKVPYSSTKSAMNGAMRAMAHELASSSVRVNNVLPGWTRTRMYDNFATTLGTSNIDKEFDMLQYMGIIETVDVANAVAFLLSDASRYITGTELRVDGGALS